MVVGDPGYSREAFRSELHASRTMAQNPDPEVKLVSEDAPSFVRELKEGSGKDIYLCGGAKLAGALLPEGLIDEVILKVNPVLFGAGIPLFSDSIPQTALTMLDSRIYGNGVALIHYRVDR